MTIVELSQAGEQLPEVIRRVESGEEIVLARDGRLVAQIKPCHGAPPVPKPREGGQWEGRLWISPDFDAPLPDDIARAFGMIDE